MTSISVLQQVRSKYQPKLPQLLAENFAQLEGLASGPTTALADVSDLQDIFENTFGQPIVSFQKGNGQNKLNANALKVGVVLSGGPAPGGHNVIVGLFEGLKKLNSKSTLYGFRQGPGGIVEGRYMEITDECVATYRNTGGFDMIQSGRTKIESPEQFAACLSNCTKMGLSALVVIGGDDSNTNAALLAEYFKSKGSSVQVIGVPKTIDGDLKNEQIEISFGFDTACKLYAELVGNICRDAVSSAKYWHFIRIMGRSASHISLEVALQTRTNASLVGEEVEAENQTLDSIAESLARIVAERAQKGKSYGVVLVPEGLIEFIPEVGRLISAINDTLASYAEVFEAAKSFEEKRDNLLKHLESENAKLLRLLPANIQKQLLLDRDPHGNVQVALIQTEALLAELVTEKLKDYKARGVYSAKFSYLTHYLGYEGRCAAPTNFDADYTYGLGFVASLLTAGGYTGYLSSLRDLTKPSAQWVAGGIPLTMMMNMEKRHGKNKPVIRKALVELKGKPFAAFKAQRDLWAIEDAYTYPGPIQYFGPSEVCDITTQTLKLERS